MGRAGFLKTKDEKGEKDIYNITHISRSGKKKEFFFFQYRDDGDHVRFESAYGVKDLEQGRQVHHLEALNSFHRSQRSTNTLHTLYGFCLDIDGTNDPFPLSHLDILERWQELGFAQLPTEIRRTSQGRFHVIIAIQPARAFPDKISFWKKCAHGLYSGFKDIGADEFATTNPVGFVRIPGHRNCKYPDKPVIETVYESDSVFTLSDIHQTLTDSGILQPAIDKNKSTSEKIAILEKGVPPGIGNNSCFTLAIYYKEQGLSEGESLDKLLLWNENLQSPDPPYRVRNTVKSTYKNGYSLSLKALGKWASIALDWQENPPIAREAKLVKPMIERNKIQGYADKIRSFLEAGGGHLTISQRALAKNLNIPFRSFSHAVQTIPGLSLKALGRGRSAKTEMLLRKDTPHLRVVYTKPPPNPAETDQLNDANK